MHGNCAGILRCVRESSRAVMCFYVAAWHGAGSVGLAGDGPAHAGLMPSEATDTSEGGLWRTPFSFISINKVAFLNKRPHSLFLPYPSLHQHSPGFWISASHSFPPNPSPGQESCGVFFPFCSLMCSLKEQMSAERGLLQTSTCVTSTLKSQNLFLLPSSEVSTAAVFRVGLTTSRTRILGQQTSLGVQCLWIHLAMQGTPVPSHPSKQLNPRAITTEPRCRQLENPCTSTKDLSRDNEDPSCCN